IRRATGDEQKARQRSEVMGKGLQFHDESRLWVCLPVIRDGLGDFFHNGQRQARKKFHARTDFLKTGPGIRRRFIRE
ncbi:MAG: hypothetical protein OXI10_06880, partial [Gammaproteobacteria bacterium]|nr:hypothetical protein [Gammaproteobacteria bacterium]